MKRFRTRQKNVKLRLIVVILAFFFFLWLFIYISSFKLHRSYKNFINYIMNDSPMENTARYNVLNYLMGNLDYLITDYLFYDEEKSLAANNNMIYIYNTHDSEEYHYSAGMPSFGVLNASYMLKEDLLRYKLLSSVEEKRVSSYLTGNDYDKSYQISREFMEKASLNNNYNYFIDIHRDSATSVHTEVLIDGRKYARIMFVLGLDNTSYESNRELMVKLNNYLETNYKGISRGIYEKSGNDVNGVYNQDFHKNVILIEIGGVDSDLESVSNSTQIIAEALYDVIGDLNEKSD